VTEPRPTDRSPPAFRLRGAAKLHETDPPCGLHPTDLDDAGARTIALLGPNGSGKSTLLGLLAGLHRPTAGKVLIADSPAGSDAAARRSVGVAFQTPALDALLTVRENLRLFAALHGLTRTPDRVAGAIERFGLREHADRRVGRLSGGLARRADLARATLHEPALLLLDEPAAGLDPAAADALLGAIRELASTETGRTVLWSTHDLREAERAERVVILRDGRVALDGAPAALIGYDLLTDDGADLRERPLEARRAALRRLLGDRSARLMVSEELPFETWDGLARLRAGSRERGVEGLMLKRRGSVYKAGRSRGLGTGGGLG